RIISGLQSSLLSSLNGGAGLGTLGSIAITDRNNHSATVDLSSAQTLDDVIEDINSAGIGVHAQVNDARNGIEIVDTTGLTAHNLTIANADATNTADKLGLTVDAATNSKSSGSLNLQTVSQSTLLSKLNGGAGIGAGSIKITGTSGQSATLNIGSKIQTVGDLIQAINVLNIGVTAQLNSTGDGIVLVDTAHGAGTLAVASASGTTAKDLHLLGGSQTVSVNGVPTQEINGSSTLTLTLSSSTTLQGLADQINGAQYGVQASVSNDGTSVKPFRLTLSNALSGKSAALQIDTSGVNFSLSETVAAQDAVAVFGSPNSPNSVLATSSNNTFSNLVSGVSVSLNNVSPNPVTVTVGSTNSSLETALQTIVTSYNKLQSQISTDTSFDSTTNTAAVLQGDPTINQVNTDLGNLISGDITGAGSLRSLAQLGIIIQQDGTLSFDTTQFEAQYAKDPQAVQDLLSTKNTGVSDRFNTLINSLAGPDTSLLVTRAATLQSKLDDGNSRLDLLNTQLSDLRTRLTTQF
ncbi:MAG TPA: flagellar filament capping protein FliD, partial [Pirellulales bacterium]